jgi:hypothetical protein
MLNLKTTPVERSFDRAQRVKPLMIRHPQGSHSFVPFRMEIGHDSNLKE